MATEQERLTARIILRAVLPASKVLIEEDAKMRRRFEGLNATIQFVAQDETGPLGAYLRFTDGAFSVGWDLVENPDIEFRFSSVGKMVALFTGKPVIPSIKGILKVGLLIKVFSILLGLKILMPDAKPKTDELKRIKVKMTLYMISTALSQMNKGGDPDMMAWTAKQPERIYQWSVDNTDIACHLRVKAGKTKAGRGPYTRRKPFVHMRFRDIDAALPILGNQIDTVTAMTKGYVINDGSPEYGGQVGDLMLKIAGMLE